MASLSVAIIGACDEGKSLYEMLEDIDFLDVNTVVNLPNHKPNDYFLENQIKLSDIDAVVKNNEADLLIVSTNAKEYVLKNLSHYIAIKPTIIGDALNLIKIIQQENKDLEEAKSLKGELAVILSSVQEAIEVADNDGTIKYVNPAFSRVTGIPEHDRIGKNIFEVSPGGALARSLREQKSVFGHRSKVGGSGVEVASNASPILVDDKIVGAVVVFQHMNDIFKLMEELQKSNKLIENLYAKIGQISGAKYEFKDFIGKSSKFIASTKMALKAAESDSTVLIMGESGTGKELFAHAMHNASFRRDRPFIKVNSAAIPESLLESEFFGYEKGAFTGAVKTKLGKVEIANGGTLFMDEIGDMNPFLQAKLLRFLQEKEFERVGGNETINVDVRIIAATNRNLKKMVENGEFREDLYFRLNVIELNIPPLRERKDDIDLFCNQLIRKFNRRLGKQVMGLSHEAKEYMQKYDWPGNVRELENVIERAMVATEQSIIDVEHIIHYLQYPIKLEQNKIDDIVPLEEMEEQLIKKALEKYGTTLEGKKAAAQKLNISLATLYNKLKKYSF